MVEHVYLTGYTATPPRMEISKTALGAEEWIPWSMHTDPHEALQKAKNDGCHIVCLEIHEKSTDVFDFEWPERVCIVVGHEIEGVPEDIQAMSDAVVHIPMHGQKQSLNVSVAAGIVLSLARNAA